MVICQHQRLAQNGLAVPMRNLRKQIRARILYQSNHLVQVVLELLHAFVPIGFAYRARRFWPIAFRKSGRDMLSVAAEFENVPLRDARMLQQLPTSVRQAGRKRTALVGRELFQRVHELHVRGAALQQIDHVLAQRRIVHARAFSMRAFPRCTFPACLLAACPRARLLFLQADFSETITCCGISGTGCSVDFVNPALRYIFSYSANVYASPESVFASMIRLNAAAVGGVTRSSLGTNSSVIALPPGFSAACTRRINFSQVGISKW